MLATHIYITVDSTFPKISEKAYGYVLECEGKEKTIAGFGRVEATYHCTVLRALIEAISRFRVSCEIHIHTGNSYITAMIDNNLHKWAATQFMTARGNPISNQKEWMELWEMFEKHLIFTECGTHSYEKWLQMEIENWKFEQQKSEKCG